MAMARLFAAAKPMFSVNRSACQPAGRLSSARSDSSREALSTTITVKSR